MRWIVVPLALALAPAASSLAAGASVISESSDQLGYVLLTGSGNDNMMMSGSTDDFRRAQAYRSAGAPLLYVRDGGAAYVIRDPALLRRAEVIVQPQQELGERQGELGRQQGELGRAQGGLGKAQGQIGSLMADATPRQMSALGRQQSELGQKQAALGQQQAALGRRQAELGREQARLAELARPQFRALIADAIRLGLAQRVE